MTRATGGGTTSETRTEYQVEAPTSFAGVASTTPLRYTSTVLSGPGSGTVANGRSYSTITGTDVVTYGNVVTSTTFGITITTTITLNPAMIRRYSLAVGESFTQTYTSTTTGTPFPIPATTTTFTDTFLGFEDVTVPAGTFAGACKWQTVQDGVTTTAWFSRFGVPLKSVSSGSEMVLVSATINGGPAR